MGSRRRKSSIPAYRDGDPAPGFTLSTPHGVSVSLEDLLEERTLVLEFIRGTWDPNAKTRLEELARVRTSFLELEGRIAVVTCERPGEAKRFLETGSEPRTLLVDTGGDTAKRYGVYQRFSYGAFGVARPSTWVIDRCGFVRMAHAGRSPIDAAPIVAIETALEACRRTRA